MRAKRLAQRPGPGHTRRALVVVKTRPVAPLVRRWNAAQRVRARVLERLWKSVLPDDQPSEQGALGNGADPWVSRV